MPAEKPLPIVLLTRINRDDEAIRSKEGIKRSLWQNLDDFIPDAKSRVDVDWPESVFMPFGLWPFFLERHYHMPERSFDLNHPASRGMAQVLSCIAPWRPTQDIVKFDPDIEAELKAMKSDGNLPAEVLLRLPAWCVYIDAALRVDGDDYDGFFVQLDTNHNGVYMALTFQGTDNRQQRIPLLLGGMTLGESLAAMNRLAKSYGETEVVQDDPGLVQALNLVTYLCAYGLVDRQDCSDHAASWPKPKKTKQGWRIFPPDKPKIHLLGTTFGEKIRRERPAGGGGETRRPHVRRPHWHHFWKGSRDSRHLIVHWLPPIFVGNVDIDDKPSDGNNL